MPHEEKGLCLAIMGMETKAALASSLRSMLTMLFFEHSPIVRMNFFLLSHSDFGLDRPLMCGAAGVMNKAR
jgi:hypothetical protein